MKKVDPKLRAFVIDLIQKHGWNMGVSNYTVDVQYMDEEKEADSGKVAGEMVVNRRYLSGTMRLYPLVMEAWKHGNKTLVEETVSHELAHIITQHFFDLATSTYKDSGEMHDAWEMCTEVIAQLSRKLQNAKS